jgi:Calcineurin-like phosphoesterase/Purple acid Phosphatase, N-terminal domain
MATMIRKGTTVALAVLTVATAVSLAPAPARGAPGAPLTRYPYLTDLVGGSVTVNWATTRTSSVTGWVKWGKADGSCTANATAATRTAITVGSVRQYQWRATLPLAADTRYCYRVYLGTSPQTDLLGADVSPRFTAQVPAGSSIPFRFAVFGDWGQAGADGDNQHQVNLMRRLAASGARFAVSTGDIGYPSGSQANYGDLQQTGPGRSGVFGPRYWAVPGRSLPLLPVAGNHAPDGTFLTNWPQPQAVAGSKGRYQLDDYCCLNGIDAERYASTWYAFDAGNARFYVLLAAWDGGNLGVASQYQNDFDQHWGPDSPQYRWLEADLEAHRATPLKFAVFHYPLSSDQSSQSSDAYLQGPGSLEGLLNRHGVDIAFNGHAHVYQRNLKPHPGGLVSYVSGGFGASLASIGTAGCSATDAYGTGWSNSTATGGACGAAPVPTGTDQVFHFLLVDVDGTKVTVTPTDERGTVFDRVRYDFRSDGAGAPGAPGTPTAEGVGASQVNLAWPAATDDVGVNAYTVYRDDLALATVRGWSTRYTDRGVDPATTYRYRVVATDGNGRSSPSSAAVAVTTGRQGAVLRFAPVKDTYVDAGAPAEAHGAGTRIHADRSPARKALLAFAVAGTGGCPVASARLRLYNVDAAPRGGDVRPLADLGWDERTVTWDTAPATDTLPVAWLDGVSRNRWYEVDVTGLVAGDGPVGLAITSTASDGAGYSSREGPAGQRPELVVECGSP